VQTLVENSVKYAVAPRREGGTIEVTVKRQGASVSIEVLDDGPASTKGRSSLVTGSTTCALGWQRSSESAVLGDRTVLVELDRVTHFVAEDKLTFAVAGRERWVVDESINLLEARLPAFFRIHRSTLVRLARVREVVGRGEGGVFVRLDDAEATELPVARDRVRALRQRLGA